MVQLYAQFNRLLLRVAERRGDGRLGERRGVGVHISYARLTLGLCEGLRIRKLPTL